jgi:hypothetical protein
MMKVGILVKVGTDTEKIREIAEMYKMDYEFVWVNNICKEEEIRKEIEEILTKGKYEQIIVTSTCDYEYLFQLANQMSTELGLGAIYKGEDELWYFADEDETMDIIADEEAGMIINEMTNQN